MKRRHYCLTCSAEITEDQEKTIVLNHPVLYLHAHYQDCQKALAGPSERSAALHSYRLKNRSGHVVNHPGQDDYYPG